MYARCSRISGRHRDDPKFFYPRLSGLALPIDGGPVIVVAIDYRTMDVVHEFCYLDDKLSGDGYTVILSDAKLPKANLRCCSLTLLWLQLYKIFSA